MLPARGRTAALGHLLPKQRRRLGASRAGAGAGAPAHAGGVLAARDAAGGRQYVHGDVGGGAEQEEVEGEVSAVAARPVLHHCLHDAPPARLPPPGITSRAARHAARRPFARGGARWRERSAAHLVGGLEVELCGVDGDVSAGGFQVAGILGDGVEGLLRVRVGLKCELRSKTIIMLLLQQGNVMVCDHSRIPLPATFQRHRLAQRKSDQHFE